MNPSARNKDHTIPRIILFGVSGCGKSTVASLLAKLLDVPFIEADDFHPKANIYKMKSGIPLNDEDRKPWLDTLNSELHKRSETGFVLACSALKEQYRKLLSDGILGIRWIYLDGSFDTIHQRMKEREHFMKPEMLQSQFDALEIPEYGIHCSIEYPPEEIVNQILEQLSE
ncbi:MAG: gluconokinase [bacterium]|nr:gluconokinase [bacterium]